MQFTSNTSPERLSTPKMRSLAKAPLLLQAEFVSLNSHAPTLEVNEPVEFVSVSGVDVASGTGA